MIEITAQDMGFAEGCVLLTPEEAQQELRDDPCLLCYSPPLAVVCKRLSGDFLAMVLFDGFAVSGHYGGEIKPKSKSLFWGIEFLEKIGVLAPCLIFPGETHDLWIFKSLKRGSKEVEED